MSRTGLIFLILLTVLCLGGSVSCWAQTVTSSPPPTAATAAAATTAANTNQNTAANATAAANAATASTNAAVNAYKNTVAATTVNPTIGTGTPTTTTATQATDDCAPVNSHKGGPTGTYGDDNPAGSFNLAYQAGMAEKGTLKIQKIEDMDSAWGKIQSAGYACKQTYQFIKGLIGLLDDPTDFIVRALTAAVLQMIISVINQVCQAVMATVYSLYNQVLSSLKSLANIACIPLPSFGFGGINLGLPSVPCKGNPLIANAIRNGVFQGSNGQGAYPSSGSSQRWGAFGRNSQ